MTSATKTLKELQAENDDLRLRLEEAEETLRAIGSGEVDAFVVSGPGGEQQVFTLKGAELPYRILVESMNEGAATLAADGTILYCNKHLSSLLKVPMENLTGTKLGSYVGPSSYLTYAALLKNCTQESQSEEISMTTAAGKSIPVFFSCCANDITGTQGISVVVTDLTLQKRNAEILASEKFATSIVEQSCEAIIVCDAKGSIIRASQTAHALCGTNPLLKQFDKIFPLQITESGKKFSFTQIKREGKITSIEVEFKRDETQTFNLLLNATILKSLQNQDIGLVVHLTDITSRKRAEIALQLSEDRLQSAYSHLQIVNKELQVANKELQAQSEELQAQSEELQAQSEELLYKNLELQQLWDKSKQSEEAVRKSEERHRVLAETMLQGVVHQDAGGTIISMNPAAERILGKSREDFLGNSSVDVEHDTIRENGELFPGMEHPTMVALRTGRPVHGVMGVFNPKLQEYRWIGIDAVPVFRPGEDLPSETYSVFEDITERKKSTIVLQANEERMQQALHVSRSFTFEWLPDTDEVIRSTSCAAILNLSGDEAVNDTGEHFFQCIHPDDRARFGQALRDLTPTADSYIMEYRYVSKDGTEIMLEETGQASFDSAGKLLRLVGVTTDITARKQAEEALREVHAQLESRIEERTADLAKTIDILLEEIYERHKAELNLQRLNRLYAVLSETNQTIVKISDRNSLFRDFCRIAVEYGGFILAWIGLVDGQNNEVKIAAASGATEYLKDIRISSDKEPEGEGPTGIALREGSYYICNDFLNDPNTRPWHERGKKHGIRASASIAIKENGQVVGALTLYGGEKDYFDAAQVELLLQMGMDISFALDNINRETIRREAEKALFEETLERLKTVEALREKEQLLIQQSRQAAMGEMIGNIAHQWRQPLNTLGLYTQMLGTFYGTPDFNKEFLDNSIAKSLEIIKHMSKTIDDFRDYFKPIKEKTDFYLIGAIKNTLSLLESSFNNPKISIEILEHGNPPVVKGYQNEFAQVFLNILNNARDAMIEREIADGRIIITICTDNDCAVVTVADNAGGIPDDIIDKVFDPYFTTKGPQVGTGIGLFMSKTIIEKSMNGRLTVRNTDTGAEFRIEVGHGT